MMGNIFDKDASAVLRRERFCCEEYLIIVINV